MRPTLLSFTACLVLGCSGAAAPVARRFDALAFVAETTAAPHQGR